MSDRRRDGRLGRPRALLPLTAALLVATALLSACGQRLTSRKLAPGEVAHGRFGVPYQLTKPQFKVELQPKSDTKPQAMYSLTLSYVPDTQERYALNLQPALFSEADFGLTFGDHGNLTKTTAESRDKVKPTVKALSDFAVAAIGAAARLSGNASALADEVRSETVHEMQIERMIERMGSGLLDALKENRRKELEEELEEELQDELAEKLTELAEELERELTEPEKEAEKQRFVPLEKQRRSQLEKQLEQLDQLKNKLTKRMKATRSRRGFLTTMYWMIDGERTLLEFAGNDTAQKRSERIGATRPAYETALAVMDVTDTDGTDRPMNEKEKTEWDRVKNIVKSAVRSGNDQPLLLMDGQGYVPPEGAEAVKDRVSDLAVSAIAYLAAAADDSALVSPIIHLTADQRRYRHLQALGLEIDRLELAQLAVNGPLDTPALVGHREEYDKTLGITEQRKQQLALQVFLESIPREETTLPSGTKMISPALDEYRIAQEELTTVEVLITAKLAAARTAGAITPPAPPAPPATKPAPAAPPVPSVPWVHMQIAYVINAQLERIQRDSSATSPGDAEAVRRRIESSFGTDKSSWPQFVVVIEEGR